MRATVISALVFGILLFAGLTQIKVQSKEAAAQEKPAQAAPQGQSKTTAPVQEKSEVVLPDASVAIQEQTLNKFFGAVGPVSGKGKFDFAGSKSDYTWTVKNPRIKIATDKASFIADASVKVGPFNYKSDAKGAVEVKYDTTDNRISVRVLKADFEVYTKIFKKKIHITTIDVSKFYRPEFEFAGPQPLQESVPIDMPDGSVKTVYISTKDQTLHLEEGRIVVASNLVFSDKPPVKEEPETQEPAKEKAQEPANERAQ
jgi:hypothetical protein